MNNVLLVCDYGSLYSGNFIKSIRALANQLEKKDYRCYFAFPTQVKDREWIYLFRRESVDYIDFRSDVLHIVKAIHRLLKLHSISIIHTHFVSPNYAKLLSVLHPKIKVFVHLHSDFSGGQITVKDRMKEFVTYRLLTSGVIFLCVSNAFVRKNPGSSVWIPNGLVCDTKTRAPAERDELRRRYNISNETVLCELFGWSPRVKGVDIAVEAVKLVNAAGHPCKLAIVFGRECDEMKMRQYIAANTSCTGDEDFLVYLPPEEDVFAYHNAADIHLSASRSEGFPYSILEMLSIGKRCVVSSIPGTSWAGEYDSVISFQSENAVDCAKAILTAMTVHQFDAAMAEKVRRDYSIEKWVDAVVTQYEKASAS